MHFAGDTESALVFAASLVNTARGGAELLPDQEELTRFLDADHWTGRRDGTREELTGVRALRPRLRKFWEAAGVD
ncbi:ABATE domain-containing protein, partial [Rhodococcus erythropolis]|nr:ABATE domain-containing protein [Rhodococcus erythropolis]